MDETIELALCEQNHLVLKPDQKYIFKVMLNCEECNKLALLSLERVVELNKNQKVELT